MNLSQRLEAIRNKNKPTPLFTFLYIYSLANRECFIEYMHGAKELIKYLGDISYPTDKYPEILNPNFKVPRLLKGFDTSELARLLEPYEKYNNTEAYLRANTIAENAIYFVMSREIIIHLY